MADRKPVPEPAGSGRGAVFSPTLEPSASPPPSRDRSARPSFGSSSLGANHRASLHETLRSHPPSPRQHRHPSLSQIAVQELVNNPPAARPSDPAFAGRDWKEIHVGELVSTKNVAFVELDTGVEAATKLLIDSGSPVILIRESVSHNSAVSTFDYSDLNAYLLLVVGLAHPDESHVSSFEELAKKAREGNKIPIKDVKDLSRKEPLVTLPHTANLTKAVEIFGSGSHRIVVVKEGTNEVHGILSQLRLVRFLWENARSFPIIDQLYPHMMRDLSIGSSQVISINGDKPLTDALDVMDNEGITSLAVVDGQLNVIGNISIGDVKHLTSTSALPLLQSSCIHFISVILSNRGMNEGKDSFPVFYVNPYSTLAHTVAKLVATRAHRMWVVDSPSPASSAPSTPGAQHAVLVPPPGIQPSSNVPAAGPPFSVAPSPAVSASALPSTGMSGRLNGVISLTDILNLFARTSGLSPTDPNEARMQRRRSSSSSVRPSMDISRSPSVDLRRNCWIRV